MEEAFWMVLADNSTHTAHRHQSLESAKREAERLAALNPDVRFYVLGACGYHVVRKPSTWTKLAVIPF